VHLSLINCCTQAGSFYEAAPLGILDSLSYNLFRAEVLDGLKQKVKTLSPDSFAMLVVQREPAPASSSSSSGPGMSLRQGHEAWLPHNSDNDSGAGSSSDSDAESSSSSTLAASSGSPQAGDVVGVIEVAIQVRASGLEAHTHAWVCVSACSLLLTLSGFARPHTTRLHAGVWHTPAGTGCMLLRS